MRNDFQDPVLIGGVEKRKIKIVDYNPNWPEKFEEHSRRIRNVIDDRLLQIEHIGSTAVPDLATKPIIDILVIVEDAGNESTYLPYLESAGYVLRVREPDWHEHRMFRTPELDVHIHIFSPNSPEIKRYLIFRDRLRNSVEDRNLYEQTKRRLATQLWDDMNAYAEAKSEIIERIIVDGLSGTG